MLPKEFEDYTRLLMGDHLYDRLRQGLAQETPVSIRLNPAAELMVRNAASVPWSRYGYYLSERPAFTFDPLLHAGCYYVQEASSMFAEHVVRHLSTSLPHPATVLDLCAAPGGKSLSALTALPEGSELYSNEPIRQRAQILCENLQKWQLPLRNDLSTRIHITNCYPRDYQKSKTDFDLIIADVPCSGEGMFRKDEGAIKEWSPENVARCSRLQREIISDIWPRLKPGGYLIYSTCTFNAHENEENVAWIADEMGGNFIEIPTEAAWNITGSLTHLQAPVYRFLPGLTRGEGLFLAVIQKKGTLTPTIKKKKDWQALNIMEAELLDAMQQAATAPQVEIDYQQAISYLRREAIALPAETPRGLVVVTFRGKALGLVKNIGNRANNLYPKEWRIKSTHIPESYETIFRHTEQDPH